MDEFVYNILSEYFNTLENLGYVSENKVNNLLLLLFFYNLLTEDYRGMVSKEDYSTIEKALNCLYGRTCLTPYPEYLKMGKLHLGELSELAQRVKNLEDTEVLKLDDLEDDSSDIIISEK
jgi:hypothetical protein